MTSPSSPGNRVFKVRDITHLIRLRLEEHFNRLCIEGEVSNLRTPGSGHLYFTLKDETSQIRAVMFRGHQRSLTIRPRDGMNVRAHGGLTVYERSGDYQLLVHLLEEAGQGALQARFERLKKQLSEEGLFEASRKKRLPLLPRHLGVVTSPTGAAIQDILHVVTRRFPNLHVLVAPVRVQGEGAAPRIAAAIDWLNERGGIDVIIVGRGGGSLEDLWCFNEECVARAIARSHIPVISAIGHETDYTISDFVADLRAPTPSAAAELVVGRKEAFEERLRVLLDSAQRSILHHTATLRHRLSLAAGSHGLRQPTTIVRSAMQHVDQLTLRGERALQRTLGTIRKRLEHARNNPVLHEPGRMALFARHRLNEHVRGAHRALIQRLESAQRGINEQTRNLNKIGPLFLERKRAQLEGLGGRLAAVNPFAVLQRGYSIATNARGEIIASCSQVHPGDTLVTRVHDGRLISTVGETLPADTPPTETNNP